MNGSLEGYATIYVGISSSLLSWMQVSPRQLVGFSGRGPMVMESPLLGFPLANEEFLHNSSTSALPGNSNRANLGGAFPQLLPLPVASLSLPCEGTEAS